MALTLDDVWQAALIRIGLPADDGYWNCEVKRALVNKAQRDVASVIDWPELQVEDTIATVDGTANYDLPDADQLIRLLWISLNGFVLNPLQRRQLLPFQALATQRPTYYAIGGDGSGLSQLWLAPVPDGIYNLDIGYVRKPEALDADADELLLPEHLTDPVITRTAYLQAVRKRDATTATTMLTEYTTDIARLVDEAAPVSGPRIPRVRQDTY